MKAKRHPWTVDDKDGKELFRGSKTAAYKFYRQHHGSKAGLSIGYLILEWVNGKWEDR